MDASDKEKANDHMSYTISSDWQFSNPSLGLVSSTPPVPSIHQGAQVGAGAYPSSSMVSSFGHCPWNTSANLTASRLSESSVPSDSLSGASFLQSGLGILPENFPADSAFIERAARFTCFHDGSLGRMMNPFSTPQFLNPYGNAANGLERAGAQKNEAPKNESMLTRGDPTEDQQQVNLHASGTNQFNELDNAGGGGQDAAGDSSPKELAVKKRKKTNEDAFLNRVQGASQNPTESKMENAEARSSSVPTTNSNGKDTKESPEVPKNEYIHIRARRGQATNSHSLAERLRREKISERMKFLQDLVPGCSKVTGKAVMLDEIINYVQSLQRQVEFLSMKLATVSPNVDINIEALLSKDLLQSHSSHPSHTSFPLDMVHSQLHLSQQSLPQPGASTSGILNPSDLLLRSMNSQMTSVNGYKEQVQQQMPNSWDEEIRAMQMGYNSNPTLNL